MPFQLGSEVAVSVGRHESNDLILDDMSISRRHALLMIDRGGEVYISDCNSKFGTFVELNRNVYNLRQVSLLSDRFTFSFDVGQGLA